MRYIFALALLLVAHTAMSEVQVVEARGYAPVIDADFNLAKYNATRDALRSASEQANVEIFSYSEISDSSYSSDFLMSRSAGTVSKFDVLTVAESDDKVAVDIRATVEEGGSKCLGGFKYQYAIAPAFATVSMHVGSARLVESIQPQIADEIPEISKTQYNQYFITKGNASPIKHEARLKLVNDGYQFFILPTVTDADTNNMLTVKFTAYDLLANEKMGSMKTTNASVLKRNFFDRDDADTMSKRLFAWLSELSPLPCVTPQGTILTSNPNQDVYTVSVGTEHNLRVGDKVAFFNAPQSTANHQHAIAVGVVQSAYSKRAHVKLTNKHKPLPRDAVAAPLSPSFFNL